MRYVRHLMTTRLLTILIVSLIGSMTMAQDNFYHEPYRPQFHYSPPCQWMNDPNGMVYYEGEYHLFYQFNPAAMTPFKIHWGHAVSPDLVHWQTLPIALYPDDNGPIWSGSVVVDANNTSGLVPGGGLVAIYSYENQSQGIAYSSDKGRTWTKYDGNPVIGALAKDFRDPKVFWHEASQHWVMPIAAGPELQIFVSPNLINWEHTQSFRGGILGGVWEVPDLFPLEIDGETKWIFLASISQLAPAGGGGVQYFIGDFDGRTFTYDTDAPQLWIDYGPDNYAGTTWSDLPDRRVYIGWMDNWQYATSLPTAPWRGANTLPRELRLVRTADGIRLAQSIPAEFETLRQPLGTWDDLTVDGDLVLEGVEGRTLEIIVEISASSAERFGIDVHRGAENKTRIVYNTAQSKLLISRSDQPAEGVINNFTTAFGAPIPFSAEPLRLHIFVDESSVEVLAQDGVFSITGQDFTNAADKGVALFAEKGTLEVKHLEIYALNSIWGADSDAARRADFDFCAG